MNGLTSVVLSTRWRIVGFFFQAEDGIRDLIVTGVQTCALPISRTREFQSAGRREGGVSLGGSRPRSCKIACPSPRRPSSHRCRRSVESARCRSRSEEHTSELQSRSDLVCRLLLEKKKSKQPAKP